MKNSSISSLAGMAVSGISRLALFVIIGRTLGGDALANVSGILSLAVLIGLLWPTAAGVVFGMFISNANVQLHRQEAISKWLFHAVLIFAGLTFLVAGVVSLFSGQDFYSAFVGASVVASYGVYTFLRPVSVTLQQNKRYVIAEVISSVGAVVLGWAFGSALGLLGYLIAFMVMFGGFVLLTGQIHSFKLNAPVIPPPGLAKVSGQVIITQLLTNVSVQLVLLSVLLLGTSQEAGYMSQAFALATPVAMIGFAIAQSATPHLAKQSSRKDFNLELKKILNISLPLIAGLYLGVFLLGNLAVSIVFNPIWYDQTVMQLLACGLLLYTVSLVLSAAVNSLHLPRRNTFSYVGGLAAGACSFVLLDVFHAGMVIVIAPIAFIIFSGVTVVGLLISLREKR